MRSSLFAGLTVVSALALGGTAVAATPAKPSATTSSANQVTQTSANLRGSVNPQSQMTTYYFQYGKTVAYGQQTGPASAGNGSSSISVAAPVVGLEPNTTYHFRIVATNPTGATVGAARTFKTPAQPLGFTLSASPNPVLLGGSTTISGQLTGTGSANRTVQLQSRGFPYSMGFTNVGNPQQTNAQGQFSFPILSVTANTQYRVQTTGSGTVTSPIVLVGSSVVIRVAVSAKTVKKGQRIRVAGSVAPKEDGALYALQKQRGDTWVTVGGSSLRPYTNEKSRFAIRTRVNSSGNYRIYVGVADGNHVSNASAPIPITVRSSR